MGQKFNSQVNSFLIFALFNKKLALNTLHEKTRFQDLPNKQKVPNLIFENVNSGESKKAKYRLKCHTKQKPKMIDYEGVLGKKLPKYHHELYYRKWLLYQKIKADF